MSRVLSNVLSEGEEDGPAPPEAGAVGGGHDRGVQLSQSERRHMQQVRELDAEELEVEEVGSDLDDRSDDDSSIEGRGDGGAGPHGGFTFNTDITSLVPRHTYLGDVDDVAISGRRHFSSEDAVLTLPMFYLEGIVLFPEDILPLRVLQPRFKAAVERALQQTIAPSTIGVVHVSAESRNGGGLSLIGTTAEIYQIFRLEDGSINVVTRGCQRFHVCKAWTDADGTPYAEVRIIEEEKSLHVPRAAFGLLASVPNFQSGKVKRATSPREESRAGFKDSLYFYYYSDGYMTDDDSSSSEVSSEEEEGMEESPGTVSDSGRRQQAEAARGGLDNAAAAAAAEDDSTGMANVIVRQATPKKRSRYDGWGGACKAWAADESRWRFRAQTTAWPHWVYRMYDAYDLARRAADMWRQMVALKGVADVNGSPERVSFYIASNMPIQDATKQELLEINNAVYRLRREIELLESLDHLCCKGCWRVIASRSDMLVMSTKGPISAFVNEHGYVFEALTLSRARGLMLVGAKETAHSWFPGYAWTIAHCLHCELHMGWFFSAVKPNTYPKAFWGIRRSQLAEECANLQSRRLALGR